MDTHTITIRSGDQGGAAPGGATDVPLTEQQRAAEVRRQLALAGGAQLDSAATQGQVEVELRNGTRVIMGPPRDAGVLLTISKVMQEDQENQMIFMLLKSLSYVRSINGVQVNLPKNMVEVRDICQQLGPGGEEEVFLVYGTYWPPVTTSDLKVIKKNL